MARIKESISLKVKNNLNRVVKIPVMGGTQDPSNGQANATTLYEFDLSSENFIGIQSVSILVSTITNSTPVLYEKNSINISNTKDVVDILNDFNVGVFNYQGTTIFINNDINIYGRIVLSTSVL